MSHSLCVAESRFGPIFQNPQPNTLISIAFYAYFTLQNQGQEKPNPTVQPPFFPDLFPGNEHNNQSLLHSERLLSPAQTQNCTNYIINTYKTRVIQNKRWFWEGNRDRELSGRKTRNRGKRATEECMCNSHIIFQMCVTWFAKYFMSHFITSLPHPFL